MAPRPHCFWCQTVDAHNLPVSSLLAYYIVLPYKRQGYGSEIHIFFILSHRAGYNNKGAWQKPRPFLFLDIPPRPDDAIRLAVFSASIL
jgi:hypothetical protein